MLPSGGGPEASILGTWILDMVNLKEASGGEVLENGQCEETVA